MGDAAYRALHPCYDVTCAVVYEAQRKSYSCWLVPTESVKEGGRGYHPLRVLVETIRAISFRASGVLLFRANPLLNRNNRGKQAPE